VLIQRDIHGAQEVGRDEMDKATCKYFSHLLLSMNGNGGKNENSVAINVVGRGASMAFFLSCNLACHVLMERLQKPSV
jgi:hypothetical protein